MVAVGRSNAGSHLNGNSNGLLVLQTALLVNIILESDTLDQLHDNIVKRILLHYVIDTYNIRMGQAGRGLGLHLKFIDKCLVKGKFFLQHLDGHQAV